MLKTFRRESMVSCHFSSLKYSLASPYQIISFCGCSAAIAAKISILDCDITKPFRDLFESDRLKLFCGMLARKILQCDAPRWQHLFDLESSFRTFAPRHHLRAESHAHARSRPHIYSTFCSCLHALPSLPNQHRSGCAQASGSERKHSHQTFRLFLHQAWASANSKVSSLLTILVSSSEYKSRRTTRKLMNESRAACVCE